jgi:two-component system sensor histidine kinase/response regulator
LGKSLLFKSIQRYFTALVGVPGETTLESRIFNSICVVGIVAMLYNIPFNYFIGLTEASLVSLLLFIAFSFLYYLSRIKNKFYISVSLGGVFITLLLAGNYFFNAGVIGPSILLFMYVYFLLAIVAPSRQHAFWFCFNVVVVFGLLAVEFVYPASVVGGYSSRLNHILDVGSTYLVGAVLIYLATYFFKKAYRAEQRLVEEKSVVLERLNAEKSKLFSIISHDLRSPLASVQQYIEILRETDLDDAQKKRIESDLLDVINHTQEMLFNLLSWSTTQMNGTKVELTHVNISTVLKPIIEIYKPLAFKKEIQLTYSIHTPFEVVADSNMLQLIVRNLVGNAIKFTPSGGSIVVEVLESQSNCLIVVKDNGGGIKPEDKATIFSLKSRATFGTNNEKGVGLGLFLCKEYAEVQQGKLWFESEPGEGTTFYLSLPLVRLPETVLIGKAA